MRGDLYLQSPICFTTYTGTTVLLPSKQTALGLRSGCEKKKSQTRIPAVQTVVHYFSEWVLTARIWSHYYYSMFTCPLRAIRHPVIWPSSSFRFYWSQRRDSGQLLLYLPPAAWFMRSSVVKLPADIRAVTLFRLDRRVTSTALLWLLLSQLRSETFLILGATESSETFLSFAHFFSNLPFTVKRHVNKKFKLQFC